MNECECESECKGVITRPKGIEKLQLPTQNTKIKAHQNTNINPSIQCNDKLIKSTQKLIRSNYPCFIYDNKHHLGRLQLPLDGKTVKVGNLNQRNKAEEEIKKQRSERNDKRAPQTGKPRKATPANSFWKCPAARGSRGVHAHDPSGQHASHETSGGRNTERGLLVTLEHSNLLISKDYYSKSVTAFGPCVETGERLIL